jgi:hypothetical protein
LGGQGGVVGVKAQHDYSPDGVFCSGSCRWSRGLSRSHKYKTTSFLGSLNSTWKFFEFFFAARFMVRMSGRCHSRA